jgi:hypothetical protein
VESLTTVAPSPVVFLPENHSYTVDGRVRPHVTGILKATGLSTDFDRLPPAAREAALVKREVGRLVHEATVLADLNTLKWGTLEERLFGYVEAWEAYRKQRGLKTFLLIETALASSKYLYAGTVDRVAATDDVVVLPDIKTGDSEDAGGRYQTAAYADLAAEHLSLNPKNIERECVELRENGTFRVESYNNFREDWQVFLAALTVYRAQPTRS